MRPNETPLNRTTLPDWQANDPLRVPGSRSWLRGPGCSAWLAACRWFQANTGAPRWCTIVWDHPGRHYLLAALIEMGAASLTLLLLHPLPLFALQGSLLLLGIVVVALAWGTGPSLAATLVGTTLLELLVVPPYASRLLHGMADWRSGIVTLLVGCSISLIASQSGQARRRAEALASALQKAQAESDLERLRLRVLVDALPAPVVLVDAQERMLEYNPALQTFLGVPRPPRELADVQGVNVWWPATGQPLDRSAWAIRRAVRAGERVSNEEVEIETADGQRKMVLDSAIPIRDARGRIHGAVGVLQDITERKRLEEALRQAQQEAQARARELEAIFESIADKLFVTDRAGRVRHMNQAYRTLLGLEQDPTGWTFPQLEALAGFAGSTPAGEPLLAGEDPITRVLRGEVLTTEQQVDILLRTRAGREVRLNLVGTPIRDARGQVLGSVLVGRDVTEQRRLEQQTYETLQALLAMAEALVQGSDQALEVEVEAAGAAHPVAQRLAALTQRVLECRLVGLLALEPEIAVPHPMAVVGYSREDEQQWWARWQKQTQLRQTLSPPVVAALHAGDPLRLACAPEGQILLVPMQVGETLVGVLGVRGGVEESLSQQATALIKAVARLGALVLERERLLGERTEARARELALCQTQAEMETFLGIAGHELKNPLTSIKLALQLLERRLRRLAQDKPDAAHLLASFPEEVARAGHQAVRLERLVNELLDVSRVRAGKLELHPEPTDLIAIVRETVDEQREIHPERTLTFQLSPDHTATVLADADRIGQVVTNYLTNALKYSPSERPVTVGLDLDERQARVWVRDQGPGIPSAEQAYIWDRFHRVPGILVQSGSGVGLGLGLHICYTIIQRHHGQVGVESAPGQGSTFWFTLPLRRQEYAWVIDQTEIGKPTEKEEQAHGNPTSRQGSRCG